ncbi:Uncharacterized protein TCM_032154 [Theobroma cacao]|uniref:DUF4216 domain-containing protein n=1 Tax=Theobroma cacao TaxID=3641 RepID=A0A061F942_THECC|nr:Uncharacterized protein TCM_032154 [Theobroma cacao]
MVRDAMRPEVAFNHGSENESSFVEEDSNPNASSFCSLLTNAEEPLWVGCTKHSTLSAVSQLLNVKAEYNWSESCFDRLLEIIKNMLPSDENLPINFYRMKKKVAKLGLGYIKIDACKNNCMFFYEQFATFEHCQVCGHPRYKQKNSSVRRQKKIPYKILRYLPLIPRLQRLYMSCKTVEHMTWHAQHHSDDGLLRHLVDGEEILTRLNSLPHLPFRTKCVIDVKGRTKDNIKAQQDLKVYYKRPKLELVENNGKLYKPKAAYTLNKEEIRNDLCATEIPIDHMETLQGKICKTICKLEKIFPPGFVDSMEHLSIHLPYEAKVFATVEEESKNRASVEGSICEAYVIEEVSSLCSWYFEPAVRTRVNRVPHNDDGGEVDYMGRLSIFTHPGRSFGSCDKSQFLDEDELYTADLSRSRGYYDKIFDEIVKGDVVKISEEELDKVAKHNEEIDQRIIEISYGPERMIRCYSGYFVSGFKFHTLDYGQNRKTMNSGVCIKGSFYNDRERDFYGILVDIIELEYFGIGNRVVLFKCHWFDTEKGIKVDRLHGLVDVNYNSILASNEPFVLAAQAHQVYYNSYPSRRRDRRDWWAVFKTKARSRFQIPISGDREIESDLNEGVYQEDLSNSITSTQLEEVDLTELVSGDYEKVNLSIEDEEDDIDKDEDEEDDMEGEDNEDDDEDEYEDEDDDEDEYEDEDDNEDEYEDEDEDEDHVKHNDCETYNDDRTMVKGKQSKPRPRSSYASASGNANEESSRSRGRGPSVGLQTLVDPSDRLRITLIGDSTFFKRGVTSTITRIIKNHFHGPWSTWRKVPNDIKELMFQKFQAIELKRDVTFLEVFNRTHKRSGGHGDFIDNKSKSTSEMYNSVLSQKYGDESSSQPEFNPHAWTKAIGGKETTRTHVYGFGTRVPITALLTGTQSNVATSESTCGPINSNFNSPTNALEEKVENLAQNLNKIRDKIRGEIREEMRNVMAEGMSEFMARMETMFMSNARSTLNDAGPSRLDK